MTTRAHDRSFLRFLIGGLAALTAVFALAHMAPSKITMREDGGWRVLDQWLEGWRAEMPAVRRRAAATFGEGLAETEAEVDRRVAEAFEPVRARVDDYLAFHYSFAGSHTEFAAFFAGQGASNLIRILFEETGFDARLDATVQGLGASGAERLRAAQRVVRQDIQTAGAFPNRDMRAIAPALSLTLEKVETSYAVQGKLAQAGAAMAGALGVRLAARQFMRSVGRRAAYRATGAAAARAAGAGSAATGAAAVCSPGGPVALLCGAVVGIVAYVAFDEAARRIDQFVNEDELRKSILDLIQKHEDHVKAEAKTAFRAAFCGVSDDVVRGLSDSVRTPRDAIARDPSPVAAGCPTPKLSQN